MENKIIKDTVTPITKCKYRLPCGLCDKTNKPCVIIDNKINSDKKILLEKNEK